MPQPTAITLTRRTLILALFLAACSGSTPAAITRSPAAPPATETAAPSAPPSQPSAGPGASATPAATLAATPTLAPTQTPAALNPLTGLPVSDPSVLDRRPLAIKVAHFPRRVREHQFGLSLADNVWEHYAEGGVTRFTAIFLGQTPEKVGNVRSARLIDTHLGQAYQAMVVASGSSTGTMSRFRENPDLFKRVIAEYTGYSGCPLLCREESASVTTDKLFTSPAALWALTTQLGLNGRQDLAGFVFDPQPPTGGAPAATVHIDFQVNNTVAEWRYDPATGAYAHWVDTPNMPELAAHLDALNQQPITAANVVVVYATYTPSNLHEEEGGKKYFSYDVLLAGSGPARLFRDGQMFEATWTRDDALAGLPRFVDASGQAVPFKPGNIWFDVISPNSPTRFEAGQFYARFKAPDPFPPTATATP
jgi:hypothetical protein